MPLVGRFVVIDLIVIGGLIGRHKLVAAIHRTACDTGPSGEIRQLSP